MAQRTRDRCAENSYRRPRRPSRSDALSQRIDPRVPLSQFERTSSLRQLSRATGRRSEMRQRLSTIESKGNDEIPDQQDERAHRFLVRDIRRRSRGGERNVVQRESNRCRRGRRREVASGLRCSHVLVVALVQSAASGNAPRIRLRSRRLSRPTRRTRALLGVPAKATVTVRQGWPAPFISTQFLRRCRHGAVECRAGGGLHVAHERNWCHPGSSAEKRRWRRPRRPPRTSPAVSAGPRERQPREPPPKTASPGLPPSPSSTVEDASPWMPSTIVTIDGHDGGIRRCLATTSVLRARRVGLGSALVGRVATAPSSVDPGLVDDGASGRVGSSRTPNHNRFPHRVASGQG